MNEKINSGNQKDLQRGAINYLGQYFSVYKTLSVKNVRKFKKGI